MNGMTTDRIYLEDGELGWVIENTPPRTPINCSFGPGWVAMKRQNPPSLAEKMLLLKRGIGNENMDGAGI